MRRNIRSLFERWLPFTDPLSQIRPFKSGSTTPWVGFVRLDRIGDFVLWLPAAQQLSAHYRSQGFKTYLVANKAWSDLASLTNYWDHVIPLDPPRAEWDVVYRWRSFSRVAEYKTAVLLNPTFSREFLVADALCRAIKATEKIAHKGDCRNSTLSNSIRAARWYQNLIAPPTTPPPWHELEINAQFCAASGAPSPALRLVAPPERQPHNVRLPERPFVIAMGSTRQQKVWPEQYVRATALYALNDHGLGPVIVGGEREREASARLAAQLNNSIDLTGKLTLSELTYVLIRASLILAMDSAVAHIGAAVNSPTIAVVGGGEPGRFFPYPRGTAPRLKVAYALPPCAGCEWRCVHPRFTGETFPCVSDVSPEKVCALMDELLGASS